MDLIKVESRNGEQVVSARELHNFLEVRSRFNDWIENRIEKYDFIENYDYTKILVECTRGQNKYDYIIKLDMAKELSMVENNSKGRQARKYFIECEKRLKEVAQPRLPATYLEALKELVVKEEALIEANKVIEQKNRELTHKEDVIIGLVDDIDLCDKRRRITQVVRFGNVDYRERYNLLYKEFEMKYKIDLDRRMKSDKIKDMKPKIKNKMDYIDRVLNKIPQLYEIACVIFEADMQTIMDKISYVK